MTTDEQRSGDQAEAASVLGLFGRTLDVEPPLVDLVPRAVGGAADRRRQDRLALVAAPLALVALAAAAYVVFPGSGSGSGSGPTTAATGPHAVFPPVAESQPLDPGPDVVAAAGKLCGRQWSALAPASSNMLPETQEQAVAMCTMNAEVLMTLLPGATVTLPSGGVGVEVFEVTTAAGATQVELRYLWPDSAYEKKNYGPFDECASYLTPPSPQEVTGPDGEPSMMTMHDPNEGHDRSCVQTHPARSLFGALSSDRTGQSIFYSVQNHGYGRFMISIAGPPAANGQPAKAYQPAETLQAWTAMLTDPRFNDHLQRYEYYVLAHGSADSFVVSGSKPLIQP